MNANYRREEELTACRAWMVLAFAASLVAMSADTFLGTLFFTSMFVGALLRFTAALLRAPREGE